MTNLVNFNTDFHSITMIRERWCEHANVVFSSSKFLTIPIQTSMWRIYSIKLNLKRLHFPHIFGIFSIFLHTFECVWNAIQLQNAMTDSNLNVKFCNFQMYMYLAVVKLILAALNFRWTMNFVNRNLVWYTLFSFLLLVVCFVSPDFVSSGKKPAGPVSLLDCFK